MFSLVASECPLAAPGSERRSALSLIFLLLQPASWSPLPTLRILPLFALGRQPENSTAMCNSWSGRGTNPTRQAANHDVEGFPSLRLAGPSSHLLPSGLPRDGA